MTLFGGTTYDPRLDAERLAAQLVAVRELMLDGRWRTLADIERETSAPQASVSARLRDLRKKRFGAFTVVADRAHGASGLWRYRVSAASSAPLPARSGLSAKDKRAALKELATLHASGTGFGPATVKLFAWLSQSS